MFIISSLQVFSMAYFQLEKLSLMKALPNVLLEMSLYFSASRHVKQKVASRLFSKSKRNRLILLHFY